MKICFFTHNLRQDNGAGVFSRRLIVGIRNALSADVIALTTVPGGEQYERPLVMPNKIRLAMRLWRIRAIVRDCDVIHALDAFPYGVIAAVAAVGMKKRFIITATGSGSIIPLYQRRYAPLMRFAYRRADRVTAISSFTRDEIVKKMPDLRISVINHGVDAEEFSPRLPTSRDGAPDTKRFLPYILSVGQLRWRKGYHFSIRAFAKIAVAFPRLHYVIVGKRCTDAYFDRLRNLAVELGLRDRVHILEDVDTRAALAGWYRGAELFCLFSQNVGHDVEGFGLVFLEAAAAGLPVVGSKDCGVDDAVQDGRNGTLVAGRNPDDFADAILAILRDPAKKSAMSEASRLFARVMSWDQQMGKYAELYGSF